MENSRNIHVKMAMYDHNINELWKLIGDVEKHLKKYERQRISKNLNNIILHYCISLTDIQIGLKYLTAAKEFKDEAGASYFSRIIVLSCCCLFEVQSRGMKSANLNQFYKNAKTAVVADEIENSLKKINILKDNYFDFIKEIRNKITAHKEGTGFTQLTRMKNVEINKVEKIAQMVFSTHYQIAQKIHIIERIWDDQKTK